MNGFVLSLARNALAVEFTTRLAADAGFEVVRVVPTGFADEPSLLSDYLAAGKRSVGLDLPREMARLHHLAASACAIVVDPWGKSVAEEAGFRKPMVCVGERDSSLLTEESLEGDLEFLDFHASGLGSITPRTMPGYPSAEPLCPRAHLTTIMQALQGVIALFALLYGGRGGEPTSASIGRLGTVLPLLRRELASVFYGGPVPTRNERIWKVSPAEVHRCRDGWIFVDVIENDQWLRLADFMDRPDLVDDPRFATAELRFANAEPLCAIIDAFFADQPKASWEATQRIGVPVAPVNTVDDLVTDRQLVARGFWTNSAGLTAPVMPLARAAATMSAPGLVPVSMSAPRAMPALPLAGVRVLELTHVWAGPLCGQILADLGAEVIRIESATRLDIHRRGGPYPGGTAGINRSGTWNAQNRGKLSCTLDLKSRDDVRTLLGLVSCSDVVIENFAPGTIGRLGLDLPELAKANPKIILLSLSGFGQDGPFAHALAYGPMMDAATGLSSLTSYDDGIPRAVNGWAADIGGALQGCASVLRALLAEERKATHIDISQFEAGAAFAIEELLRAANRDDPRDAGRTGGLYGAFESQTPDRFVALQAAREQMPTLAALVGGPELKARVATALADGQDARGLLVPTLTAWAKKWSRSELLAKLRSAGIPAVLVATMVDVIDDPELQARGGWLDTIHPEVGPIRSYGPAIHVAGAAPNLKPAPCLGEHNDYVRDLVRNAGRSRASKPLLPAN